MAVLLENEKFYHIYNHANGNDLLFANDENYRFFLKKYKEHISPFVKTYAYCLMPNHFHLLIQINIGENALLTSKKFQTLGMLCSKQFSNFFSSYTQAFNKQQNRRGSLFMPNFKRKEITNQIYLLQLVVYIHNNPVKHGFVNMPEQWGASSYNSILADNSEFIEKNKLISWFDNIVNFKNIHKHSAQLTKELQLEE